MVLDKADKREEAKVKKMRAAKAEAGRKKKYEYHERKKKVAELEKDNHRYIYIFRTDDEKWWKVGWNSLLFYRYIVAKRVGREAHVNPDHDYGVKSPTGIVSLRDESLESLIDKMKELNYKLRVKMSNKDLAVMDLDYEVSDEDIKRYRKAEDAKVEYLNKLVPTVMTMPEIESELAEVGRQMHAVLNRMTVIDRKLFGNDMMNLVMYSLRYYYYMTHDEMPPEEALEKIKRNMLKLRAYMHSAMRIDLISKDAAMKIGTNIVELERKLKSRLGEKASSAGEIIRKNESK